MQLTEGGVELGYKWWMSEVEPVRAVIVEDDWLSVAMLVGVLAEVGGVAVVNSEGEWIELGEGASKLADELVVKTRMDAEKRLGRVESADVVFMDGCLDGDESMPEDGRVLVGLVEGWRRRPLVVGISSEERFNRQMGADVVDFGKDSLGDRRRVREVIKLAQVMRGY